MRDHLWIPDTQQKEGVDNSHLGWAGEYALEHRIPVWIHAGDHWDMPTLSTYDKAVKKASDNLDIAGDIKAGNDGMLVLSAPQVKWNKNHRRAKHYNPRKVYNGGNHDWRIHRWLVAEPWNRGLYEANPIIAEGWELIKFLNPIEIDGVLYCHFFPRNAEGLVMQNRSGAPNARLQVQREGMSCTAGHKQGLDTHIQTRKDRLDRGVIAGSFYLHDEDYLTPQGNKHWHGILHKHNVVDGNYDLEEVSMDRLRRTYA